MNKKAFMIVSFCAISLCTWEAKAITPVTNPSSYEVSNIPNGYDEIVLRGDLMLGVGPNAIEAGASDNAVYIQFNQSFGSVNIAILNGNGVQVYGTVVDTSIQQVFIIPFSNVASDTYTVVLNKADNYAEGDFERE